MSLLIVLPLGMWIANRSAPLFLGLAALCFLASAVAAEGWASVLQRLRRAAGTPIGLALGGFLLWALISIGWSHRLGASMAMWGELALPMACGFFR